MVHYNHRFVQKAESSNADQHHFMESHTEPPTAALTKKANNDNFDTDHLNGV